MAPKILRGSKQLADSIRRRRLDLGMTVEEAASIANVGVKTWYRYESGESIRKDKCRGICRALGWKQFPDNNYEDNPDVTYFRSSGGWSDYLEKYYGTYAAIAFAAGSEILMDEIKEELLALSKMAKGTHIGQLDVSWLEGMLPEQFLMEYDYEFVFKLKIGVSRFRAIANTGAAIQANSVFDELILYLIYEESEMFMETIEGLGKEEYEYGEKWLYEILEDMDIITCLYSQFYLPPDHMYHMKHWDDQFCSEEEI